MSRAFKLKINGLPWTITIRKKLNENGYCIPDDRKICISYNTLRDITILRCTVMHELGHAIMAPLVHPAQKLQEESVCELLGNFAATNPGVVEKIVAWALKAKGEDNGTE